MVGLAAVVAVIIVALVLLAWLGWRYISGSKSSSRLRIDARLSTPKLSAHRRKGESNKPTMRRAPDLEPPVSAGKPGKGLGLAPQAASTQAPTSPAPANPAPASGDMDRRVFGIGVFTSALFGALIARLWSIQLINGESYEQKAEANQTIDVSLRAPRGRILDRNGEVLVGNRSSMTLVADSSVANDSRVVRRLSNLLGAPDVCIRRAIQSETEGAQSRRTIMIDVPARAVAYVTEHKGQFSGVEVESQWVRTYPEGSLACHLLGYTGSITREELTAYAESSSSTVSYQMGDVVGKSGVEYEYEEVLQGVRGTRTVHVNADGEVTGVVSEVDPEQGSDVKLTVDLKVQQAAESAILHGMEASQALDYDATGGAVVCLKCKTGEVLALASYPNFNPNFFIGGIGADLWNQMQTPDAHTPMLNRAIDGLYPPASTVKPLTTLAGLEGGVASQGSYYYCSGWWTGLGEQYGKWCWETNGHGSVSLPWGIAVSCDVVFYEIAKALYYSSTPEKIQEVFRRWGLGSKTGIDLPGEASGRVPDAQWKWDWFTQASDLDRSWQPGDTANIAIGQGDMLVTPLQLAYVYGTLGNGGRPMRPHVLNQILSSQTGQPLVEMRDQPRAMVKVDSDDFSFIMDALRSVLWDVPSMSYYVENLPVMAGGKSGTSEASDDPANPHAVFCMLAPIDDPEYVVCSFIEHGGGGGDITTSVCEEVLAAIYDAPVNDYIGINVRRQVQANTGEGVGA